MNQIEMISLEDLIPASHSYRKFAQIWQFKYAEKQLKKQVKANPNEGFGMLRLFKCLLLQFMEDLSDRELARYVQENTACKWFCGFGLAENTPDYSVFCKARKRIGTKLLSKLFSNMKEQLQSAGYMNETFTFIDATHLIAKANLWEERDKAIKEKHDKLNNEILPEVAHDKQARIGCKGKNKYWYGYKKHISVDMQSGLINKVAVTPANITDAKGLKHVCPSSGAIYSDKGYCTNQANRDAMRRGCYLSAIKKNNMKGKNKEKDRWVSHLRSPYERVFVAKSKRVRYRGVMKNQFAAFMQAICFNLKRLVALDALNLSLS